MCGEKVDLRIKELFQCHLLMISVDGIGWGDLMLEFSLKIKKMEKIRKSLWKFILLSFSYYWRSEQVSHPIEVMGTFVHHVISGVLQKLFFPPKHLSHATLRKHFLGQSLSTVYIKYLEKVTSSWVSPFAFLQFMPCVCQPVVSIISTDPDFTGINCKTVL